VEGGFLSGEASRFHRQGKKVGDRHLRRRHAVRAVPGHASREGQAVSASIHSGKSSWAGQGSRSEKEESQAVEVNYALETILGQIKTLRIGEWHYSIEEEKQTT